jgi:membrane protein insertase Oxa1/YidC/SpoIIIJ
MRPPMLPRKRMMKTTTLLVRCSYMRKMIELSTQILEIQEELKEMKERQQEQDD